MIDQVTEIDQEVSSALIAAAVSLARWSYDPRNPESNWAREVRNAYHGLKAAGVKSGFVCSVHYVSRFEGI